MKCSEKSRTLSRALVIVSAEIAMSDSCESHFVTLINKNRKIILSQQTDLSNQLADHSVPAAFHVRVFSAVSAIFDDS